MSEVKLEQQATDFLPAGFDPIQSMRILTDYLITLESSYNDFQKRVSVQQRQAEATIRVITKARDDLEQEKDRLTRDLLVITSQVEELESALLTANQKGINFEKQFKKLLRDNEAMEAMLSKKENDNHFLQAEVERLTKDYESSNSNLLGINSRMEELERKLAAERTHTSVQEKEVRQLSSALFEAQGKNKVLEKKFQDLENQQTDEIKKLNSRIDSNAKHELNLLRKRVRTALGPELQDMLKYENDKPSSELASNLKALMSRLVAKLEQVGFDLGG
jgi:chromosome segregation ATPase